MRGREVRGWKAEGRRREDLVVIADERDALEAAAPVLRLLQQQRDKSLDFENLSPRTGTPSG